MSVLQEVIVPDVGDFKDLPVIEIQVAIGDSVEEGDPLISIESDKATMEVPSPTKGRIAEILVTLGDKVSFGSPIIRLQPDEIGASAPSKDAPVSPLPQPAPIAASGAATASPPATGALEMRQAPAIVESALTAHVAQIAAHASPSVRYFARELGVDLGQVTGSARSGRIVRDDLVAFVKSKMTGMQNERRASSGLMDSLNLPAWPEVDFSKFGEIEQMPLSRLRKISGPNLARNWVMIPHVTNFDEADVTDLESFRADINQEYAKRGVKVTMLAFLLKAAAATLKVFPEFNSSLDGDQLILKRYFHMGFAADTPNGLVVPVIRDVDKKGIVDIAVEMSDLAGLARDGKLKPTDMQGGTFSISSLGGIGGTGFTPIINAPEVAILGAARAQVRAGWDGKQFTPRQILPLSLSWDHRVVDGAAAGRFLNYLSRTLGDFRRILL